MREKFTFNILGLYVNKFLDKLERAFQLDAKELIEVCHVRAKACIKRGGYDEAISLCQKALKLDHDDIEAHYQLGVAYKEERPGYAHQRDRLRPGR